MDHRTFLKAQAETNMVLNVICINVSMLRSYKLFNEKNLYRLCGADCLWLPNSIFLFLCFFRHHLIPEEAARTLPYPYRHTYRALKLCNYMSANSFAHLELSRYPCIINGFNLKYSYGIFNDNLFQPWHDGCMKAEIASLSQVCQSVDHRNP